MDPLYLDRSRADSLLREISVMALSFSQRQSDLLSGTSQEIEQLTLFFSPDSNGLSLDLANVRRRRVAVLIVPKKMLT